MVFWDHSSELSQAVFLISTPAKASFSRARSMLGDGMSVFALQAFYLTIFSHVVRRDVLSKMCPPLSFSMCKKQEGDDDVDGDGFEFDDIE